MLQLPEVRGSRENGDQTRMIYRSLKSEMAKVFNSGRRGMQLVACPGSRSSFRLSAARSSCSEVGYHRLSKGGHGSVGSCA